VTNTEYRAAITALGLSQIGAAKAIGVTERTSRRYAATGVPEKHSAWVRDKLAAYQTSQWAETFSLMTKASEQEGEDQ
jgi:hypothetical protein